MDPNWVLPSFQNANYADLYKFIQTHSEVTTSQHFSTPTSISVKDFKHLRKAKQVVELKRLLQAKTSIHALLQLRTNVALLEKMQTFLTTKMAMNIHLKPYLRNLATMPIEQFTNHHMTEEAFRLEVEETIWDCTVTGMSVKEFLSKKELLDKWGLTEAKCEMFFKASLKEWGTAEYRKDGIIKIEKDGKSTHRYQYGGETLGYLLSVTDSISLIDPPFSKVSRSMEKYLPNLIQK